MRKILIFTVLALLSIVGLKTANAEVINMNQTFTTDTVFNQFTPPPPPGRCDLYLKDFGDD
jgi:hypothetical protein